MSAFRLPRDVWRLGWVSLATDAASEAIYPLLPFFLTPVLSAGAISLGIVGAAKAWTHVSCDSLRRPRWHRPALFLMVPVPRTYN